MSQLDPRLAELLAEPHDGERPRPERRFGMEAGSVYPASHARSLLNPLRRLIQSPRRTVRAMGLEEHAYVLELGCGPGYFSADLARAVPDGYLVLFDLQAEMLEIASARLRELTNVGYVQGDATALPFEDACFDAALLVAVLGEIPERAEALSELRRVLRVGGVLTVCETRTDSDFIPLADLREMLEEHHLDFLEVRGSRLQYAACFAAA